MMEYIRRYLIYIRKQYNAEDLKYKFEYKLLGITAGAIIAGFLLDMFIPFNFILNALRGAIAYIIGAAGASFAYLMSYKYKIRQRKEVKEYISLRDRFSYRQRVNFSILVGSIAFLIVLFGSNSSPIYTFKSGLAIGVVLLLVIFSRRKRDEFINDVYNIPDVRDLEFDKKRREKETAKKNEE